MKIKIQVQRELERAYNIIFKQCTPLMVQKIEGNNKFKTSPFIVNDVYEQSPIIFDPLSYLNASKSSYRIDEVKESLSKAHDYLNEYKIKYDKKFFILTPSCF